MGHQFTVEFNRGWLRRPGKRQAYGGLIQARNSRYLPGDERRLWALLGRGVYNSTAAPAGSNPTDDDATVKAIFPIYFDGASGKIVMHKGGALFEGDLDDSGSFAEAKDLRAPSDSTIVVPRGVPAAYRRGAGSTIWLYPTKITTRANKYLWARDSTAWRVGGHLTPTDTFTAAGNGVGSFDSTTDVKLLFRIYDNTTGTESAHSAVVTVSANFGPVAQIRWTFTNGVSLQADELGTHVRLYRTLVNEPAGIYYRIDGTGDGIAIGDVTAGYTFDDSVDNVTAQLQGVVRADGQEGTVAWAEHGGPAPVAGGVTIYNDHAVYFDIHQRASDIIYSAQGYPEVCPVDFDGVYAYFLTMHSDKDDQVLRCIKAGVYLLVMGRNSIFKISHLPTLAEPGFTSGGKIQDLLTDQHGIASKFAVAGFGIGADQSQQVVYVSSEHGLMLTDGIGTKHIVATTDFLSLVEPGYLDQIEVANYVGMQEVWVFYTPVGETSNKEALILDYSQFEQRGLRVTGPVDVQAVSAFWAIGTDEKPRFYLADATSRKVFIQDAPTTTDGQENTNASGDIRVEWDTARYFPFSQRKMGQVHRCLLYGASGTERSFTLTHYSLIGDEENTVIETIRVGANDSSDVAGISALGQGFRETIRYQGATGSRYPVGEDFTNAPPAIEALEYEYGDVGPVGPTR